MNKEDYPPSLRHAAYHAFKNGISYKFVARASNVPVSTAREWYSSFRRGETRWAMLPDADTTQDAEAGAAAAAQKELSAAEKVAVVEALERGELTGRAASARLGVAPSTIRYWRRRIARLRQKADAEAAETGTQLTLLLFPVAAEEEDPEPSLFDGLLDE